MPQIIRTNVLNKFQEHWTIYGVSRVLKRHVGNVFQPNGTILELIQDIIESEINVASSEKCPAPHGHVFQSTGTIIELVQDIIGTNLLTKFQEFYYSHRRFHEDQTINVPYNKNDPPVGDLFFQPTGTIFELAKDIIGINLQTKFHKIRQ
ncbi:hypothetical protein DPMN_015346 [Dreissena polymorpha]|uniref:Uncharacterized protein n=1 Tax=Dreissena polymorpha TaxID=45954 RepID=A0A9D4S5H2_DREPO|nr:hypothetical protein DPMN_015346 [Dreissena polymorpha]